MSTRLLPFSLSLLVVVAAAGCGGSGVTIETSAERFRPSPAGNATLAAAAGWKVKKGAKGPGRQPAEEPGPGPDDPMPGVDPMPGEPEPMPGTGTPTDPDSNPKDPIPLPTPGVGGEGTPGEKPDQIELAAQDAHIPISSELLKGSWKGEPRVYMVERAEWKPDGQLFIVDFGKTADLDGNPVAVVRISYEADGQLVRQNPVQYTLNLESKLGLFSLGNQRILIRAIDPNVIEIRGTENGFTVVRYYKRIPG